MNREMRARHRDLEWRRESLYREERRELAELDRAAEDEADAERLRMRGDDE